MSDVAAVEVKNLVKDFKGPFRGGKVHAVRDVSLTIAPGEVYGLIGPNGSGKSTTMKAVLGLVAPTSGMCAIFGRNSTKVDSRSEVGFLPENPYFYKHLTGAETVKFYGRLCGMKGLELKHRVEEMLELVGLQDARDRRLKGFSKGMLQRIGLAQALVQDPKLVVLDEPTAGVDPVGSREIRDLILELKNRGVTVFLCSHLLEQVQEICDRVGIIHQGVLVNEGRLDDLISLEDKTELILENASAELMEQIRSLVEVTHGAGVISEGRARTTLESLFLKETQSKTTGVPKKSRRVSK
ncbi:MAG: ABC-2 type transport system ATP-binding protein [Akkermansiaceae bacterium]|jgi:ABC-2 type transport system ATP-binding protein|tara:strand:- start:2768 stop:3658 length:891 start_codon:yes stop_codon:yes gene_type:complete